MIRVHGAEAAAGDEGASDDEWVAEPTTGEYDRILSLLSDQGCRTILCAADAPKTASELAGVCDISLSTVYRKVDSLVETPLLEERTRVRRFGKHPREYRRQTDRVQLRLPPDHRVVVDLRIAGDDAEDPAEGTPDLEFGP